MLMDLKNKVIGILSSGGDPKSQRQDQINQNVRDFLAFFFQLGNGDPLRVNAVEIKIPTDQMKAVLDGGEGEFAQHRLSQDVGYFSHFSDLEWAVIFDCDCDGDPVHGEQLFVALLENRSGE